MCECYKCSQRVRKAGAHRDTIEIESGRSSGGVGIGLRGLRLYSGRTYYRKKEIWLCHDCYLARSRPWWSRRPAPAPAPAPAAPAGESKYLAALEREMGGAARQSERSAAVLTAVFIGGAVLLSIVMLPVFFRGNSTDHADRTAVVAPLQDASKLNPPPSVIMTAQNRLIELGFLAGPADGVWGTKSRAALRAFKIANGLASDDKWDALVSGRLYSTQAVRSPLPLAATGR
jgi:putative peptidoglycan binding protein